MQQSASPDLLGQAAGTIVASSFELLVSTLQLLKVMPLLRIVDAQSRLDPNSGGLDASFRSAALLGS